MIRSAMCKHRVERNMGIDLTNGESFFLGCGDGDADKCGRNASRNRLTINATNAIARKRVDGLITARRF